MPVLDMPLDDYELRYQRLRAAGLPGWAGERHGRALAELASVLNRLKGHEAFPKPPARMLELGCGNGMSSFLLAQDGYQAHGIDIAASAVEWARERFSDAGLAGDFHHGSVCAMPFLPDATFELVVDGSCLHCLIGEDRARCLQEVRRVLRPGGVFVVSSMCGPPKSDSARAQFDPDRGCLVKDGKPYRTLKSKAALEAEVAEAGFAIRTTAVNKNPWWDHLTLMCVR